jgi:hypothetical protein
MHLFFVLLWMYRLKPVVCGQYHSLFVSCLFIHWLYLVTCQRVLRRRGRTWVLGAGGASRRLVLQRALSPLDTPDASLCDSAWARGMPLICWESARIVWRTNAGSALSASHLRPPPFVVRVVRALGYAHANNIFFLLHALMYVFRRIYRERPAQTFTV